MGVIYRHIAAGRCIPDYGLHGVLRVTICGISGMRNAVVAATGKSAAWMDDMYFFARKCRILSKLSCFAMEGSHRRLKHMLRNSGGLSLLCGRLGVQVVVDNHTIDDSLCREGWDATKMSMRGQGPVTVRHLARRARNRALTDLNYAQVLSQRFTRRRKQRA